MTWGKLGKHGKKLRSEIGECGNDRGANQGVRSGCEHDFHNNLHVAFLLHMWGRI